MKEIIENLLEYNSENGNFYWKVNRSRQAKKGQLAGNANNGYCKIKIKGKLYAAHRLVFLLEEGEFPEEFVDHINGDKSDNRRANLRKASRSQNGFNRGPNKSNKLNVKNVSWHNQKYRVVIQVNNKPKFIGAFDNLELAELVAIEARSKYYGEFNPVQ